MVPPARMDRPAMLPDSCIDEPCIEEPGIDEPAIDDPGIEGSCIDESCWLAANAKGAMAQKAAVSMKRRIFISIHRWHEPG